MNKYSGDKGDHVMKKRKASKIISAVRDGFIRETAFAFTKAYLQKNGYNPLIAGGLNLIDILDATNEDYTELLYGRLKPRKKTNNLFDPIAKQISNHFQSNIGLFKPDGKMIMRKFSNEDKIKVTELLYYLITLTKIIAIDDLRKISSAELSKQFRTSTGIELSRQYWDMKLKTSFHPDIKNRHNEKKMEHLRKKLTLKFKGL